MFLYYKFVMLRLDDMQDLSLIFDCKLLKRTSRFDVKGMLDDLKNLTVFKANLRNVKLKFNILYD